MTKNSATKNFDSLRSRKKRLPSVHASSGFRLPSKFALWAG